MRNAYMLGVTHGRAKPINQTLGLPRRFGRRGLALRLRADPRTYDRQAADHSGGPCACGVLLRSSQSINRDPARAAQSELGPGADGRARNESGVPGIYVLSSRHFSHAIQKNLPK